MPKKVLPSQRVWLTPAQAADRIGVSERSIRRYIAEGNLPARRIGKRLLRVDANDVDQLLVVEPSLAQAGL